MATAPLPFFYGPPYTYPSIAAYTPPVSGFFSTMAQAPYTSPSAATTYHQPIPFAPPAFPYAATYPYPPPASVYMPTSGFSPNWPIWPPPPPAPSSIPTQIDQNRPPPTPPPPIHGDSYLSSVLHPLHHHHFPAPTGHLQVQGTPQPTAVPTALASEDRPPQRNTSTPSVDSDLFSQLSATGMPTPSHSPSDPTRHSLEDDAAVLPATDERAQVKDATRLRQHREIISFQARLDKQMARDRSHRTSLDKLHGELSKLSALVSQFAVAMGMETTEAPVTGSSPASAQFRSPAMIALMFSGMGAAASSLACSLSSPSDASATAVVIPQMRDEMPQCYGLDNLNRQSLFLADGTERSYYALPENYPLERPSPEPVFDICDEQMDGCSHEFVDVFVATPEQQACEEGQQESGQLLTCISKTTRTEQTSAYVNHNSDVFDYTLEQQQQKDEKASVNVQQLRDPQWNVLVTHERRKEWDPGDIIAALHTSILTVETSNHLTECNSLKYLLHSAEIRYPRTMSCFFILRYCSVKCNSWLNTVLLSMCDQEFSLDKGRQLQWDPGKHTGVSSVLNRGSVNVYFTTHVLLVLSASCSESTENGLADQELMANASSKVAALTWHSSLRGTLSILSSTTYTWDPRDTELQVLFSSATSATKSQCRDGYKSAMVQLLVVKLGARRALIFESALMRSYAFGLGWTEVNGSALIVLAFPCSTCTFVAKQSMLLSRIDNIRTNHSFPKLVMDSICTITVVQVTKQKHSLEFLLMTEMLHNSEFRDGQLAYMPQVNAVSEEATDFTVLHGPFIHDDRSVKLTNEKRTQVVYILCVNAAIVHCHDGRSEINIKKQYMVTNKHDITSPCDMNNGKEVPFVLLYQLPQSSVPCTWDPGIAIFSDIYSWLKMRAVVTLTWLQRPSLNDLQCQLPMSETSYVWDPGTMLLGYKYIWCLLFTVEKVMIGLIPEQWSSWYNAMHYCRNFQRCTTISSLFQFHQDIKFNGIDLWMIHFLPP